MAIGAPLAPVARQRVFTNLGVVAPGAKLHTYFVGTLLNQPTYSDSALSVANANPLTASASGLFGPVYLSFGATYRFVVNEANDSTLIWDQDNIVAGVSEGSTVTILVGTQNNLVIAPGVTVLSCQNATDLTLTGVALTGLVAVPEEGSQLLIQADGAGNVILPHNNAGSIARYRFQNVATSAPTYLKPLRGFALYQYDLRSGRWRLIAHEQGGWITPTFNAADFTANTGSWTLTAPDVLCNAFYLQGARLSVAIDLATTTITATPTNVIQAIPGGYTYDNTASDVTVPYIANPSGVYAACLVQVVGAGLVYFPTIAGTGNWGTTVNTTAVRASVSFGVL